MKTISIVLPVYNEEAVLPSFHAELFRVLDLLRDRYRFHVIYVLDRSGDNSAGVLRELAAQHSGVTVLHLSRRFGHQMSLVAGIDYSDGDAVIMMDCDLQHPPDVIPRLLDAYEDHHDIVHAIRRYDNDIGLLKRFTSRLFYKLQNALSPIEIEEGAADFRLISYKVAEVFRTSVREQNQFLRSLFRWVGYSSTSIRFVSPARSKGATKYDIERLLAFSVQGIMSFSKVPLRIATALGLVLSMLSMLYGLWAVSSYFFTTHPQPGYTTIIMGVMFIGGLQLFVVGVLGEYVGAIFEEVKGRPLYIVDEIMGAVSSRVAGKRGVSPGVAATRYVEDRS